MEEKKEKPIDYLKHYVKPHKKVSREVKEKNIPRVIKDAKILHKLCFIKRGIYPSAFALAHQQITKRKPLRFFVFADGRIIVNPVITRHTRHTVRSTEGCLSWPDREPVAVQRWNKCEVEYQTIKDDKLSEKRAESLVA